MSADLRVARVFVVHDCYKLQFLAESFNLLNRANRRVDISDDGLMNTAASFVTRRRHRGSQAVSRLVSRVAGILVAHKRLCSPAVAVRGENQLLAISN
jgi:hypothetical protein